MLPDSNLLTYFMHSGTSYREDEYRDLKNRVLYHEKLREFHDRNMSYKVGSFKEKSQGGDFILEGKVQCQKLVAPKGETWLTLARCLDNFEDIYLSVS